MTGKRISKRTAKKTAKRSTSSRALRFMGIRIADPAVKPKTTTVEKIRKAVASAAAHSKT